MLQTPEKLISNSHKVSHAGSLVGPPRWWVALGRYVVGRTTLFRRPESAGRIRASSTDCHDVLLWAVFCFQEAKPLLLRSDVTSAVY